ncbi:hypothetical protein [Nocardia sp. XZ_19_385]|uniref:hypothetical protein n=1 Tax=Nocardia sp. XZ_19_385 TaxID=2769488 RepID=UPI0018909058|nr:hypothetical protein [Nocardia sp. XZ_19_385]
MTLTERLIAPNASRGEVVCGFGAAILGAATIFVLSLLADLAIWRVAVLTVVAFDLFGGAVVNSTCAAKLWYYRPGRTALHHLGFVAIHIQPFILAWALPGFTWSTAAAIYAIALLGALAVTAAPQPLRRPTAFAATVFGIAIATTILTVPHIAAWFAPILLVKLLLAHLLPEEATR